MRRDDDVDTGRRQPALLLVSIALVAYGVYHGLYAASMLAGAWSPLLLLAFALQAVLAILAAVGVWRRRRWAAVSLLMLGASVAATALTESFVLGLIGWLYALLIAIAAIAIALLLALYVDRSSPRIDGRAASSQARSWLRG